MSGHSKWSTIKRKKSAVDAKRGKIFTKLIREIQVAAKVGGADENANPRLRAAIQSAKAANMPLANIEKAIKKGTGELEGVNYEEYIYEGYGPGGVAILIKCLTDNKNRTVSELRHILTKHGGSLATNGSVSWMFENKGIIVVDKNICSEDDLLSIVIDAGAEDVNTEGDYYEIYTDSLSFENVKRALESENIPIQESSLSMVPQNIVKVEEDIAPKVLNLMEELEDSDDVQNVYANFDIDNEILEKISQD
jgi:YebC/PmpR family DNA-binding regulatory protein